MRATKSGLGLDTTDFFTPSLAGAKSVQSLRIVGNIGFGIPRTRPLGNRSQNDVLTYGASVARAVTSRAELVGGSRTCVDAPAPAPSGDRESKSRA